MTSSTCTVQPVCLSSLHVPFHSLSTQVPPSPSGYFFFISQFCWGISQCDYILWQRGVCVQSGNFSLITPHGYSFSNTHSVGGDLANHALPLPCECPWPLLSWQRWATVWMMGFTQENHPCHARWTERVKKYFVHAMLLWSFWSVKW